GRRFAASPGRPGFPLKLPQHRVGKSARLTATWSSMLEAVALTDKGCVRTNNEDYCLVQPDLGLYILADGMGGAKAGERASRLAVDTVSETVTTAGRRDPQILLSAVEEANKKVLAA